MTQPHICLIVAMDLEGAIGKDGRLPWHLPADLRNFRNQTLNHAVVMGRNTYESIGHALPNRQNIVLSRDPAFAPSDCTIARSKEDVLKITQSEPIVYVIGGSQVYELFLPVADSILATIVEAHVERTDAYFPKETTTFAKTVVTVHEQDDRHPHRLRFEVWTPKLVRT